MATGKRILVNRANSRKSTGPKTPLGKRMSSRNAKLHGLSQPISEELHSDQIGAIVDCIKDECASMDEARELAKRILDYERNEAYQRALLLGDAHTKEGETKALAIAELQMLSKGMYASLAKEDTERFTTFRTRLTRKERTFEKHWIRDVLKLFTRSNQLKIRKARQEDVVHQRYLKRAANQLTKHLRQMYPSS